MIAPELVSILECPRCGSVLAQEMHSLLRCRTCDAQFDVVEDIPIFDGSADNGEDIDINRTKWKELWDKFDWAANLSGYERDNLPYIRRHLGDPPPGWFLELGGGPSYLSFDLSSRGLNVVSMDLDLSILIKAREHFLRHHRNGYFVCANVMRPPFRSGIFTASAGIGVLEHSRSLSRSVAALARITRSGGYTLQTVPHLSLLTLVNGTLRFGTVPHMPILQSVVPLVHRDLLGKRFMRYGYEESFSHRFLKTTFGQNGFRQVEVGFYDYNQTLCRRSPRLRTHMRKLMTLSLFGYRLFDDIAYVRAAR